MNDIKPYGCGISAVSNAINHRTFLTEDRLEKSKNGNNIGQLSKWMQEDNLPFYIDVLFFNHFVKKLPKLVCELVPIGDGISFSPILLSTRFSKDGLLHMVGGKIDKLGVLYLYDKQFENGMIETTLKECHKFYYSVNALYIFAGVETGDYVFI
jgi:hypothetical protein